MFRFIHKYYNLFISHSMMQLSREATGSLSGFSVLAILHIAIYLSSPSPLEDAFHKVFPEILAGSLINLSDNTLNRKL